jgi:hypothetical protein
MDEEIAKLEAHEDDIKAGVDECGVVKAAANREGEETVKAGNNVVVKKEPKESWDSRIGETC